MGIQYDYSKLPKLFSYPLEDFSCTVQGLIERKSSWQRCQTIALAILGTLVVVTAVALKVTAAIYTPIILGVGAVGVLAVFVYLIYAEIHKKEVQKWLTAFTHAINGNLEGAFQLMRQQILPNASEMLKNGAYIDRCFKRNAYKNFTTLDVRDAHEKTDNNYLLKSNFAHLILLYVIHRLQIASNPAERKLEKEKLKAEIEFCAECLDRQRIGPYPAQKAALSLLRQENDALLEEQLKKIPVPKKMFVGHGLFLSILSWLKEYDQKYLDNIADASKIGRSVGANCLENWKINLLKAQKWMIAENRWGTEENRMINGLLKARDMRELATSCIGISREEIQQRGLQY